MKVNEVKASRESTKQKKKMKIKSTEKERAPLQSGKNLLKLHAPLSYLLSDLIRSVSLTLSFVLFWQGWVLRNEILDYPASCADAVMQFQTQSAKQ